MVYMGSKRRVAKYIVPIIQSYIDKGGYDTYLEPFVGGANVIDKISCNKRIGADANPYLIALLQYVQKGGSLPETVSEEEFKAVRANKEAYEPWYVGCVGFLASYRSHFLHTYAFPSEKYGNQYKRQRNNILKQKDALSGIRFQTADYREHQPTGCVIYCDPPYQGTESYNRMKKIEHDLFWEQVRQWSQDNIVLVSERTAPEDFVLLWEGETLQQMSYGSCKRQTNTERLFIHESIYKP